VKGGEQVYLPEFQHGQKSIIVKDQEYHHLINVRRFEPDDEVWIVNGLGLAGLARVSDVEAQTAHLEVRRLEENRGELDVHLTLAIANLKGDHLNVVVEKATELGVHEIIPLLTDRTIKKGVNLDRLNRIAVSAMKQSRRSHLPVIRELTSFKAAIAENHTGVHLFCHADDSSVDLHRQTNIHSASRIVVWIGPEGDWSKDEIDLAWNSDYTSTGLGPRRLRAETAAIHAVGLLSALLQDPA